MPKARTHDSQQKAHWCFTWNNPDGHIEWPSNVRYAVYQLEEGEEGTQHFQGYVEFERSVRFSALKKLLPEAHWEPRLGSRDEARDYCMKKDDTYIEGPWEHGTWRSAGQGNRSDMTAIRDKLEKGVPFEEVKREHFGTFARYEEYFYNYYMQYKKLQLEYPTNDDGSALELRKWQHELIKYLDEPIVRRRIIWVWSQESELGKTTFRQWLQAHYKAKVLNGCTKLWDTLMAYREHSIVLYDVPRQAPLDAELTAQLETMSDGGIVTSTKFKVMEKFVKAHIVVFCNRPPPEDKLPKRLLEICVDI